ncbi:MAG: lipid-A-disaccharide synthase [Planctomycetes bacterium]|nr:lipid-A-disaccharide synthase [Planctomycetota bacterium]
MAKRPTVFIVATESSGDNYGAMLARELRTMRPDVELYGLGGGKMESAGVTLFRNMLEHSAVGLVEVVRSLRFFLDSMDQVIEKAKELKPDVVVLIDSPDFNLRIAPRFKQLNIPVVYYVSPQLWAWREGRVEQIRKFIDRMLVIFPFEVDFYASHGIEARFVGHPMLDIIKHDEVKKRAEGLRHGFKIPAKKKVIGLFPGSRRAEVSRLMPRMLDAAREIYNRRKDVIFLVGCSPWFNPDRYKAAISDHEDLPLRAIHGRSHEVMSLADFSLICSGTATIEAAIVGTPFLCTYRMAWASAILAGLLVNYEWACMVNILANKQVVPELLQHQAEPLTMGLIALENLETGGPEMRRELAEVVKTLGGKGASARAAEQVLSVGGLRPVSRPISSELPVVVQARA